MNSLDLLNHLEEFLKEELKEVRLPAKNNVERPPTVFQGYLPPKVNIRNREEEENHYPFVIVRFLSNETELFESNISHFRLAIGTYSEDEQFGWKDNLLIMDLIKRRLIEIQNIGSATLTGEVNSALYEEQSKPLYHGVMEISLKMPEIKWERSPLDDY